MSPVPTLVRDVIVMRVLSAFLVACSLSTIASNLIADCDCDSFASRCACDECGTDSSVGAKRTAAKKKAAGAYKGLFYANDYSYLSDSYYDCLAIA